MSRSSGNSGKKETSISGMLLAKFMPFPGALLTTYQQIGRYYCFSVYLNMCKNNIRKGPKSHYFKPNGSQCHFEK